MCSSVALRYLVQYHKKYLKYIYKKRETREKGECRQKGGKSENNRLVVFTKVSEGKLTRKKSSYKVGRRKERRGWGGQKQAKKPKTKTNKKEGYVSSNKLYRRDVSFCGNSVLQNQNSCWPIPNRSFSALKYY
jgi:hypothetical protein